MEPLSIVSMAVSVVSLCNAAISTLYDIDRARRSYTELNRELNNLRDSFQEFEQTLEIHNDVLEHLGGRPVTCERMLSLQSDVLSKCWQLVVPKEPQRWMLRDDSRGWKNTRNFEEICAKMMHCVRSDGIRTEPAFWRLQRWIMVSNTCEILISWTTNSHVRV
jgi:hypothetical protein